MMGRDFPASGRRAKIPIALPVPTKQQQIGIAAARRFAGVAKNVTPEGSVQNTCAGTNIGTTLEFYINRPRLDDDPHGRGPTLLAGTEILASKR